MNTSATARVREAGIERVAGLTARSFQNDFVSRRRPVIVTGEASLRRAANTWTLESLARRHPLHRVSVEHYATGDRDQPGPCVAMELARYVELVQGDPAARSRYYLAGKSPAHVVPNAAGDIGVPSILDGQKISGVELFAGVDTVTHAHYHPTPLEVVLTQITGEKKLTLYPARNFRLLRPHPWYAPHHAWSRIPLRDLADARAMRNAGGCECTVRSGEMLFIPQGWFHVARGVGESISVSYIFRGSWRHAYPPIAVRDALSLAEKGFLIRPLALAAQRTGLARALLHAGAFLGVVRKPQLELWLAHLESGDDAKTT